MKDVADIHGFNALRWDDQQKIKNKIAASGMLVFIVMLASSC